MHSMRMYSFLIVDYRYSQKNRKHQKNMFMFKNMIRFPKRIIFAQQEADSNFH